VANSRTPPGLKRGRKKRAALLPREVTGRKYLQILQPFLHRLHAAYPHPNRVLFYDDVVVSYLVAFFSPALRSLRLIENASQVPGVNQYLNVESVCSSTLSDANALFDPAHLAGLIADLRKELPKGKDLKSGGDDAELLGLLDNAILVDGSFFRLAADVQWAIHAANQYGGGKGTEEDLRAGIISDSVGYLPGSFCNSPPKAMLRQIVVQYTDREGNIRRLRLLTDLLNLSAKTVADLYRKRWKIELFFRWLKVSANFRHLTSHSKNGVSLSFHVAVIAALLMVLRTGRPLSVHGYQLMGMVFAGQADLQDILPILEHREREKRLERERLARKRAAKKSA
jgi:hypothetical protein